MYMKRSFILLIYLLVLALILSGCAAGDISPEGESPLDTCLRAIAELG